MSVKQYLIENFNISERVADFCLNIEKNLTNKFSEIDSISEINQYKVLKAMQKNKLSDTHFNHSTGYGYNDIGRDTLEQIYADVFNAEDALVRPQIISGTHALTVALFGNLRYGDELYSPVGSPYDTLEGVIGHKREVKGSLKEHGIGYTELPLLADGTVDFDNIASKITDKTKLVTIQRSKGYCYRPSLTIEDIEKIIKIVKSVRSDIICMVDNCYGEFVDTKEPIDVGADLIVGSLIKNPGGGIAPTGGYICGTFDAIKQIEGRLTAPSIGREVGSYAADYRPFYQGLFLAPHTVVQSIKTAMLFSKVLSDCGYDTMPNASEPFDDIICSIRFGDKEKLIKFCQAVQYASPIDSFVTPEPWDMPGYNDQVIMAAGAFVQGSSIELSCDAPIRPPYVAYLQGGLTFEHGIIALEECLKALDRE